MLPLYYLSWIVCVLGTLMIIDPAPFLLRASLVSPPFEALSSFNKPASFPYKRVWFSQAPPKVQKLLLKVVWGRVLPLDRVQILFPHLYMSPHICVMCLSDSKTNDHLLLHCLVTQ